MAQWRTGAGAGVDKKRPAGAGAGAGVDKKQPAGAGAGAGVDKNGRGWPRPRSDYTWPSAGAVRPFSAYISVKKEDIHN